MQLTPKEYDMVKTIRAKDKKPPDHMNHKNAQEWIDYITEVIESD